jgi:antitoxin HigA-1
VTRATKVALANAVHPGNYFKSEIIEGYDLSVTETAKALGVTRAALSAFINEHSALSPEMALRIEKAFGISMDGLMRMQNSYDIAQTRRRENEIIVAPFKGKRRNSQQPRL